MMIAFVAYNPPAVDIPSPFLDLAVALGLGLLVGLQRESQARSAGLRTFALVTLSGAMAGQLVPVAGPAVAAVGLLAVAALATVDHLRDKNDSGLTTEAAMIAMYLIGLYLALGSMRIAVVLGGGVAVLLQAKARFRHIMERLGDQDVRAIMLFALLSLVILPILPNQAYGPWRVLNPFEVWMLVVLIVGINLAGYIGWKFTRDDTGTLIAGLLGGVISSTATTVSYARRTKDDEESAPLSAVVIMIATTVVLVRVVIEVGVVAPALLRSIALPVGVMLALSAAVSLAMWWRTRGMAAKMPEQENPTMLRAALTFAAMYAIVLLAVAWMRDTAGDKGLYAVAALAGLTDVDAITLSTARLARGNQVTGLELWRVILIAFVSNLVFKAGIVAVLGSRRLLKILSGPFAVLAVGAGILIAVLR
jgi:uncharacterized membrane protein (DUF4010 family)